jgi:hypothetical protein
MNIEFIYVFRTNTYMHVHKLLVTVVFTINGRRLYKFLG